MNLFTNAKTISVTLFRAALQRRFESENAYRKRDAGYDTYTGKKVDQ